MKSLRSLIDWLPYYFRASDTYIKDGKGLLERYLEIFGNYFDDKIVSDIDSLDDLIDVDNTPEVYLGYLWEFLGAMPYANPHAIDPEKWKLIFNGFDSPSTIEILKQYWVYPVNTYSNGSKDHFDLTDSQVRSLVKYSIALFSIRGTKRFFEILLKLYGLDVKIGRYFSHPATPVTDGDDSDYYGTDDDYYGSIDTLFDSLVENTRIDGQFSDLDGNCQLDKHSSCSHCITIDFKLKASDGYIYSVESNEFQRLYRRMYNLINTFLPLGARPHLIFEDVMVEETLSTFNPKTSRYVRVFIDRMPIRLLESEDPLPLEDNGDGWFIFTNSEPMIQLTSFDDQPVRLKVEVVDDGILDGEIVESTPKTFKIDFGDGNWSEDFESGHIFTISPRTYGNDYSYIIISPTSISPLEYDLVRWICPITIWFHRVYQYEIFNEQSVGPYNITINNPYVLVVIQSYAGRTSSKNADPSDDEFIGLPVKNITTGQTLSDADNGDITIEIAGEEYEISTSQYEGRHCYIDVVTKPGIYEYRQDGRPENYLKVEVGIDYNNEKPTISRVSGTDSYIVDNDNPTTGYLKYLSKDSQYLLTVGANIANQKTQVLYLDSEDVYLLEVMDQHLNTFTVAQRCLSGDTNYFEDEVLIDSTNLRSLILWPQQDAKLKFSISYLTEPINKAYQVLEIILNKSILSVDGPEVVEKVHMVYLNEGTNSNKITIDQTLEHAYIEIDGVIQTNLDKYPISCKEITVSLIELLNEFFDLWDDSFDLKLKIKLRTLYSHNPIIVDLGNPRRRYNSGEGFYLDDPGIYVFKAMNTETNVYSDSSMGVNIISNKYKDRYILELFDDGNTSDDEEYMLRMAVPESINGANPDTVIPYTFKVRLTLNMSIIDAQDILTIDPNAFDFQVLVYRGTTPNQGVLIGNIPSTEFLPKLTDEKGNLLPNYMVEANVTWNYVKGHYNVGTVIIGEGESEVEVDNRPPGVYCFQLHDVRKAVQNTPTYRCIDIYEQSIRGENNLFFDVDIISRAWVKPAAQAYDYDNQGNRTWGFYKTHPDFKYSVRSCKYDPSITNTMPQFRLNLDNNPMGYKRVMMYKLVDNTVDNQWDSGSQYTPIKYGPDEEDPYNHWLGESQGGVSDEWIATENQKWVFTGTVYQLGELITGPQEPGKYIFRIEQLKQIVDGNVVWLDTKPINYAYLEVKEDIQYSLIIDPKVSILQGTAVITNINVISSSKFTKEELVVKVVGPDNQEYSEEYTPPFSFYAYQVGEYIFTLYRREANNTLTPLVSGKFKVLSESGISDEYLSWSWSDESRKLVDVVTTSSDVDWTVKIQDE